MSLLLAVGISLSVSSSASAYKLKDYFLEEPKISFVCENWADSKTKSAAVRAVEAWRNAVSPVVTFDSSAAVTVFFNDGNLPEVEWDGYCQTVHYTDGRVIRSFITFNSAKSTWNNTSALQSVAVHELGHAMGLDDLYDGSKAIMNGYTGQRYGIHKLTTPQSDDIKGINALYK